jgi:hypothetical protein
MGFSINVPNVPGLPPVIFAPGAGQIISLLTADALSLFAGLIGAPWGIYLGPIPVIIADNVVAFGFKQVYQISDFPVEGGQFQSYNKVYQPFQARFRFTAGGSLVNRQALLDSVAAFIGDTNIYNVVTADAVYQGVNLTSYSYDQSATNGVGLLSVDVVAEQVKIAPSALLSNVLDPSSASQVNDGTVQATAPSLAQLGTLPRLW